MQEEKIAGKNPQDRYISEPVAEILTAVGTTTMGAFWTYTTPSTSAAYSSQFFQSLTFNQVVGHTYPSFLPPNTVTTWMFTDEIPTTARSTIILYDEVIPDLADLDPIMRGLEDEYNNGRRSVILVFHDQNSDVTTEHLCHFSKVCTYIFVLYSFAQIRNVLEAATFCQFEQLPNTSRLCMSTCRPPDFRAMLFTFASGQIS